MRILVVEDNEAVRSAVRRALTARGHAVVEAATAGEARVAAADDVDAIVLDVNLPDGSGFDVCRTLRETGVTTPIIMLTARDAVADRVEGLDAGADDYLVKPFATVELDARLRAITRRSLGDDGRDDDGDLVECAGVRLDLVACTAERDGRPLDLTRTERLLLELFLRNPDRVLTRDVILDRVWGMDARTSSNGVEVYVGYLRRKLEADGAPRLIETVRGVGYALRPVA